MQRELQQIIQGRDTSDGAGVRIKRSLGQNQQTRFDPFLMLDEFGSNSPDDYIAGFPPHPHRGFETVTYMLEGHMLHEDHMGNKGHLRSGDIQWMTAGRGIIHSEMPQQDQGTMRGFQLWVNLAATEKMQAAQYQDISKDKIPKVDLPQGGSLKVIANSAVINGATINGPIQKPTTEVIYWDLQLPKSVEFHHALPELHNCFIYVYEGEVAIGDNQAKLSKSNLGLLSKGEQLRLQSNADNTQLLIIAGRPLNEPIAQYGPFVMNSSEEIEQAIKDYRSGELINY
jgi:quercetin 2,3-dioxygenase